jgi:hypothetical protein
MSCARRAQILPKTTLWQDTKTFLSSWLRSQELRSIGDDEEKIRQITEASENETIRKWLWIVSIAGAPVCFIVIPIALSILTIIFSNFIIQILWFLAKLAMAVELALFGLAIYVTWYMNSRS